MSEPVSVKLITHVIAKTLMMQDDLRFVSSYSLGVIWKMLTDEVEFNLE